VTPVLPLQAIACGLIVVLFDFNVEVDLVPDPLGWAAVLYGAGRLPAAFAQRSALVTLAAVAGAISVLEWIPGLSSELEGPAAAALGVLAVVTAIGTVMTIIVLCFRHASRPWIGGTLAPADR
jgi:hypothetical protein